jgi:Zn finger protein HypA/HybF involved in hydrogenase expression
MKAPCITWETAKMQRIDSSITFTCPRCRETFKFDHSGEYELAPCPICGTEFITIRKGQALLLEPLGLTRKAQTFGTKLLVYLS